MARSKARQLSMSICSKGGCNKRSDSSRSGVRGAVHHSRPPQDLQNVDALLAPAEPLQNSPEWRRIGVDAVGGEDSIGTDVDTDDLAYARIAHHIDGQVIDRRTVGEQLAIVDDRRQYAGNCDTRAQPSPQFAAAMNRNLT